MPGIAELALAGAPIAGGALLGIAAGNLRPPDVRGMIAKDMDLLDRLPEDQVERRAELQRVAGEVALPYTGALGLPALTRAIKLQNRAARVGFDWPSADELPADPDLVAAMDQDAVALLHRRGLRHENLASDAHRAAGISHALRMIAGRGRNNSPVPLLLRQIRHPV